MGRTDTGPGARRAPPVPGGQAAAALLAAVAALVATAALTALPPATARAAAPIFQLSDPRGDDHGGGALLYPMRDDLEPGDLDLISFSARREKDGTQFEASFARPIRKPTRRPIDAGGTALDWIARHGFYTFNLDVYIDTDRETGLGETAMLPGRRAEVARAFAWDRAICLTPVPHEAEEALKRMHFEAAKERLKASSPRLDEATLDSLRQSVAADVGRQVYFPTRIRVTGPKVSFLVPDSILGGPARADWAYVVVVTGAEVTQRIDLGATLGVKQRVEPGLFIVPVRESRSPESFGGGREDDTLEPQIIDALVPEGVAQEAWLRDYDLRRGRPVRLPGVVPAGAAR
jgi:hypothetical protein